MVDAIEQFKAGNHVPLCLVAEALGPCHLVEKIPLLHLLARVFIPLRTIFPVLPERLPVSEQGQCPLFISISSRNTDSAIYMLQASKTMVVDKWHYSAVVYALRDEYLLGFVLCLAYGHRSILLPHMAALRDNRWAMELLHTLEFSLTEQDPKGETPFTLAVRNCSWQVLDYMSTRASGGIFINHPLLIDSPAKSLRQRIRENLAAMEWKVLLQRFEQHLGWDTRRMFLAKHLVTLKLMVLVLVMSQHSTASLTQSLLMGLAVVCFTWGFFIFGRKTSRLVDPAASKRSFIELVAGRSEPTDPQTAFHRVKALAEEYRVVELDRMDMQAICPRCLIFREDSVTHCEQCGECVRGWHFHWLGKCVTQQNHCFYMCFLAIHLYFLQFFLASLWMPGDYSLLAFAHTVYSVGSASWLAGVMLLVGWGALGWVLLELGIHLYCILNAMTYDEVMHPERHKRLYKLVTAGEHGVFIRKRWLDKPYRWVQYLENVGWYLKVSLSGTH